MLFNSLEFLIFFPIVILLYFAIPHRWRWILLLGASYYFYMAWRPEYVILIVASTLIDYYSGIQMGKTKIKSKRRKFLALSLVSNLGLLFAFKYFNFFNDSLRAIFNHYNIFYNVPAFDVLLPIGISFYTFQTLSYSIDVYRGHKQPEKHLGIFALYVSFFPQLVAGPIERSVRLLPQFHEEKDIDYQRIADGLKLMTWGFFKKLVIADRLAVLVDNIYNNPTEYTGIPLIVATYFFAYQIYCDFSGYTDIARGAAKVMGYDLMENFRQPYFSKSVSEFWKRWHISLSTWFRDYFYIPLGGNRVTKWRWYYNLLVVFLVSGLWHGASWTFVIWGGLHGFYLISFILTSGIREKISKRLHLQQFPTAQKYLAIFITFHLVVFAWIFFRANSLADASYIVSHLFTSIELRSSYQMGLGKYEFVIAILSIVLLEVVHLIERQQDIVRYISAKPIWFRWAAYYAVSLGVLMFGKLGLTNFIYFQF